MTERASSEYPLWNKSYKVIGCAVLGNSRESHCSRPSMVQEDFDRASDGNTRAFARPEILLERKAFHSLKRARLTDTARSYHNKLWPSFTLLAVCCVSERGWLWSFLEEDVRDCEERRRNLWTSSPIAAIWTNCAVAVVFVSGAHVSSPEGWMAFYWRGQQDQHDCLSYWLQVL